MRRLLASVLIVVPLSLAQSLAGCASDPADVEGSWLTVGARVPDVLEGRFLSAIDAIATAERDGDLLILRGPDTTLSLEKRQ